MNIDDFLNRSELNERLDGDIDLYRDLADIFLTDSIELLEKIHDAIESSDAAAVGKTAHTLKGAVSNFSAPKAFEAALKLEKIGKAGDLTEASQAFEDLKIEIESAKEAIAALAKEDSLV